VSWADQNIFQQPSPGGSGVKPVELTITEVTRRAVFDSLTVAGIAWAGQLGEDDFLARVWDTSAMPSTDYRYKTAAEDIWKHRVMNNDWPDDWVLFDQRFNLLRCSDSEFGRFLAEVLHPAVRDGEEVRELAASLNDYLAADGWELRETDQMSGRPLFSAAKRDALHAATESIDVERYERLNQPGAINQHLRRIERDLNSDPPGAIAASKELVETVCKTILRDYNVTYSDGWDMMQLFKAVQQELRLNVDAVADSKKGSEASVKALRALVTTVQSLAELRNELGLGHGREQPSLALTRPARYLARSASGVILQDVGRSDWALRRAASYEWFGERPRS
jgi:hypothetical protein